MLTKNGLTQASPTSDYYYEDLARREKEIEAIGPSEKDISDMLNHVGGRRKRRSKYLRGIMFSEAILFDSLMLTEEFEKEMEFWNFLQDMSDPEWDVPTN